MRKNHPQRIHVLLHHQNPVAAELSKQRGGFFKRLIHIFINPINSIPYADPMIRLL